MRRVALIARAGAGAALCGVLLAGTAAAQQPGAWDYRAPGMTRAQLEALGARFDSAARSPAYSEGLRARAREGAEAVRARLRDGDIHVGDRVRVEVEGQASLTDSFTVASGPALFLPGVGRVPLAGVLRSELQAQVTNSVDRVFRGVTVRVRPLTRIVVVGGVTRPGFYALPTDALVEDAIAAAGGLLADSRVTAAVVERGRTVLIRPDSLQAALQRRATIDDLRLLDGDRINIPIAAPRNQSQTVQTMSYLLTIPLSMYTLVQLVKTF